MADWNPQANEIFLKALDIRSPEERLAFLDSACAGNAGLRVQVDSNCCPRVIKPAASWNLRLPHSTRTINQPISEQPGAIVGPYKLLQQIGEGGMGVVYMAEQTRAGRASGGAEDHQAGDGLPQGHCPLRGRAAGVGPDGPSKYRQGARCWRHRFRAALFRDGAGQRACPSLSTAMKNTLHCARAVGTACCQFVKQSSTRTKKGSSTGTLNPPMSWWPSTMAGLSPK